MIDLSGRIAIVTGGASGIGQGISGVLADQGAVIALFLVARLLTGLTLLASARAAAQATMPYQRGQFWIRRFKAQASALSVALAALMTPPAAADFVLRALRMLESIGWIAAHRFLLSQLRVHLLGWPACLVPHGRPITVPPVAGIS